MYVKTSLAVPKAPPGEFWQAKAPNFDGMSWENHPMTIFNEVGCTYGLPSAMPMSELACAPNSLGATYSEGGYGWTEKHETGSDASTADTSPNIMEEGFYLDAGAPDMAWHGIYAPISIGSPAEAPFPSYDPELQLAHARRPGAHSRQSWQKSESQASQMQDTLTLGSAKHHLGQCKPCAFAWKPEGCQSGPECKFCHICPPGEKQRRKRVLRQIQRSVGIYK